MDTRAWFALSVEDVVQDLKTDQVQGLSATEAHNRHLSRGPNRLPRPKRDTLVQRVARLLTSPIALILIFAMVGAVFVGTLADVLVIATALFINVVIGAFQEERAADAFDALRHSQVKRATVIRDGAPAEVDASALVPGDLVTLIAGSAVPADIRLVEAHAIETNESMLSGEWVPIEKDVEPTKLETVLAERSCMVYAGTLISAGAGKGVVVAIGPDTEFGKIAVALASTPEPETPLERDMRRVARLLLIVAGAAVLLVFGLALFDGTNMRDAALMSIAIAVAAVPEGLPAAVTVALALGMERILKKGGLVKGLLAAETLGATSVVLTDKTGTLTEGRMRITGFATVSGTTEDLSGDRAKRILRAAVLASDGFIEQVPAKLPGDDVIKAHGRPMEQAIVLSGFSAGISETDLRQQFPRIDELPFTADRRYGGVLVRESENHNVAYLSGAPELFIEHARTLHAPEGIRTFTPKDAAVFAGALRRAAQSRERVIAIARVPWQQDTLPPSELLDELLDHIELQGFIIFSDPIRSEAKAAVAAMRAAGTRIVMATGDNPDTALAIARTVGIAGSRARALTGADITGLSDEDLYTTVMAHTVFARVAPEDKLRIANVLTAHDEVVAMTGDGVNDAPALHAAAIGIALGSGTAVARDAADLVLLNDSFSVITAAITEGRRLRDNVKKIFTFLVSTNFSETILIIVALIARLPLPLLPVQILWSNLISGGAMNVAFAFEPLYPSAMRRSPKDPETTTILSPSTLRLIVLIGLTTGGLLVALFLFLQNAGVPEDEIRTLLFVGTSFDAMFTTLSLKSFGTPIWRIPLSSNRFLVYALAISVGLLAVALFVPGLASIIHAVPLHPRDIGILAGLGVLDLIMVEVIKFWLFIRPERRARTAAAW